MMTRKRFLAESLKASALLLGGAAVLAGCDSGGVDKGAQDAQISKDRQAELDAQAKAREENAKKAQP